MLTKTEDASYTLFSEQYGQTYHSSFGAVAESLHVFLHGSGVFERLKNQQPTRVLEIGFGLGLNCLLSADCAAKYKTTLDYTGIENQPISAATFKELQYQECLSTPELANDLAAVFEQVDTCQAHSKLTPLIVSNTLGKHTALSLVLANATDPGLEGRITKTTSDKTPFDAIYLDAFSPDCNPECWTSDFFKQLANLLSSNGRLATYCVKGEVRRNLQAAGFTVHKYPGPTGKREVLWASAD